ncbi:N-6 adenine-specific DNA methylase [Neoasaia chiangmaiensis NBRC 101099]|uniref:16S rRNA (Guanine(966)-N(2))-methyltransferase RsmD n=1 Tax=Neoasaia chiangmaiensis TaxID=320497 RepID=A0A1U9KQ97_9PROT|nr:16S rRNA (guanine(966)-N(2))-methyltransferase RsmD [Neoasaia chiangmaiensis]AQS87947.1 16S rRNA (guanine(966)-N(2))-methyltransferase RsmD [Neoasaia chiangmaiensis]GBR38985.1 N-6 adenine-specific DNA methylase [Neoasaia chiangmaiensis NBRC 101099]GEN15604.1 DNA methyltransferase [Neoasaia chiangmaiensis]
MRIVGGERRGLTLRAPAGHTTRPTADRTRQALFDMLLHAPWGGRDLFGNAAVLDVFAGTGALGLEALSRGAPHATFMEKDPAARAAIAANIAAYRAESRTRLLNADATRPPRAPTPHAIAFLDPPYAQDLVPRALDALARQGWLTPDALIVAETGTDEPPLAIENPLADRRFGAARITIWRNAG